MTTLTTGTELTRPHSDSGAVSTGGTSKKWVIVGGVIILVALFAWMAEGIAGGAKVGAALDRIPVEPHSFAIALKQKGELQASHSTDIECEVEGRSTIISLIPEGTPVKKGDLLVELASDEIDNRIRQEELKEANAITVFEAAKTELEIQRDRNKSDIRKANLQIELKRIALEKYQKGDWMQRLQDAQTAIEQAKITLRRRSEDYDAKKKLYDKKYTTKTDYDEAEFNKQKAQWELDKATRALEVLEQYTHKADLLKRKSDLEEAQKERDRVVKNAKAEEIKKVRQHEGKKKELDLIQDQLAKLRKQKKNCRIYSPTQGFVVYYSGGGRWFMSSDNQIKVGAQVIERQILMQLPDTSEMKVMVRIHEAKTNQLELGQKALITIEGFPDKEFTGHVAKIAAIADSQSSWLNPDLKEYETEIRLDPTQVALKPGVTAHVEILVDTVDQQLAVPVQSIFSKGGSRYVFRDNGGEPEAVAVELGGIGTEWAQVQSGLARGDSIFLAFNDQMKRLIPEPKRDQNGKWRSANKRGKRGAKRRGTHSSKQARVESKHNTTTASEKPNPASRTGRSKGTQ